MYLVGALSETFLVVWLACRYVITYLVLSTGSNSMKFLVSVATLAIIILILLIATICCTLQYNVIGWVEQIQWSLEKAISYYERYAS